MSKSLGVALAVSVMLSIHSWAVMADEPGGGGPGSSPMGGTGLQGGGPGEDAGPGGGMMRRRFRQGGGGGFGGPGGPGGGGGLGGPGGPGGPGGEGGMRHMAPNPRRALELQSLTPDQKTKITSILEKGEAQMKPLHQQMKDMRSQMRAADGGPGGEGGAGGPGAGGAGGAGGPGGRPQMDPQSREKFRSLMGQMMQQRQQTWDQVKGLLTEKQLDEFNQLPRGGGREGGGGGHEGWGGRRGGPGGPGGRGGPGGEGPGAPD